MSSTDEQMAERRKKNFAVRAAPTWHPDFEGEKTVFVTYNGQQEYPTQLTPHEARKLYDLLAVEFGFGEVAAAPDLSRLKRYDAVWNYDRTAELEESESGPAFLVTDVERMFVAPKLAGNGEGE